MSPTLGKNKPDVEAHQPRLLLFIVQLRNLRVPTRCKVCLQLRARVPLRCTLSLQRLLVLQRLDEIAIRTDVRRLAKSSLGAAPALWSL